MITLSSQIIIFLTESQKKWVWKKKSVDTHVLHIGLNGN